MDSVTARQLLTAERDRLVAVRASARRLQGDAVTAERAEAGDVDQGPADLATDLTEREVQQAIAGQNEDALTEIEDALARLDAGLYGVCVDCGRPIPDARLEVVPTASRCVEDQARFDRQSS